MLSYKTEITLDNEGGINKVDTLTFRGEIFTNTWIPCDVGMTTREKSFGKQIEEKFKDIPSERMEEIMHGPSIDEDDIEEYLDLLLEYEY